MVAERRLEDGRGWQGGAGRRQGKQGEGRGSREEAGRAGRRQGGGCVAEVTGRCKDDGMKMAEWWQGGRNRTQ
ncbi:hypothetical protein Pmani_040250 [Petrolisthes manimaculis]|uniref:Uncharacterized protein n=1 Tax=Petrolisthes manimaculis TaxID=1843537 RepID=A0AAE1NB15_9EUCA|nr:hypothetical protein Pmani_040250 [Petrolisthes manimaculis]